MVAGQEASPKDAEDVARLKKFWAHGRGASEIGWGTSGDFNRCRVLINQAVVKGGNKPLSDHMISGLCANLHKEATGAWPGHAPGEEAQRMAEKGARKA